MKPKKYLRKIYKVTTLKNISSFRTVNIFPGCLAVAGCLNFFTNRNVFKFINIDNNEMFPSDPLGSLDVLFLNNYNFFGGFSYGR